MPNLHQGWEVAVLGQDFNLLTIANFQNYRWKVYTIVVKTNNLGENENKEIIYFNSD